MARILMLVTQFSGRGAPADPPRQLADAFVADGHDVKVIVIPWQQSEDKVARYQEHERLEVLRVPPLQPKMFGRIGSLAMRWVFSSWAARRHARRFLRGQEIDLLYTTSPAVTMSFLIRWALRMFSPRSYLYIVDFFPFHQRAIGLVPGGLVFQFARQQESALIKRFDVVACMTPRNLDFLRAHYTLREGQRAELLPLSTRIDPTPVIDRSAVRARFGLPVDKVIAIFGGQITEGRGIEQLLDTARRARQEIPELHFVLAGKGRLTHLVEDYAAKGGVNLTLVPGLARDTYVELATACDIGLVVTVPVADIPTFPSKTLDYLQASLPVVAAVEADTDFRDFVDQHGFGRVVEAGDTSALLEALKGLARDETMRTAMAAAGRTTLHAVFDVRRAARQVLEHVSG